MADKWRITKINNLTHEVELTSATGTRINTVVPESHCKDHASHAEYLKSVIAKHETPKAIALEIIQQQYQLVIIIMLVIYVVRLKLGL